MLYRAFLAAIVALFATMWALLIRSEVDPDNAGLRLVPVEHVLRNIFAAAKDSDLVIDSGAGRVGMLRLSPKLEGALRKLEFSGHMTIALPGGGSQRPTWAGSLTLNHDWKVEDFHLSATSREFPGAGLPMEPVSAELELHPLEGRGSYLVHSRSFSSDRQEFTLDEQGLRQLMSRLGVEESLLRQLPGGKAEAPVITARLSRFMVRSERLETYLITIGMHGQTLIEAQISQLGEVLHVQTLVGWSLAEQQ